MINEEVLHLSTPRGMAVTRSRLTKLAELLEKLPRKRFNYGHWVGDDWKGKPDLSCGTTACALGWATTIPAFRRLGLHLSGSAVRLRPYYLEGVLAAQKVFLLSYDEASYLFHPDMMLSADLCMPPAPSSDTTPKQVARHIRRFLSWKEKHGVRKAK